MAALYASALSVSTRARAFVASVSSSISPRGLCQFVDLPPEIEAEVQRHLIVAASGRVELLAHVTQAACQHLFDEHVDILGPGIDGEHPALQILQDPLEPVDELRGLVLGDDALGPQHGDVGHGAGGVGVGQLDELELPAGPEDQLLGKP